MSGHLERLEAYLDARDAADETETIDAIADGSRDGERPGMYRRKLTRTDLRAAVDELKQLRAEQRSEFRLLLAELEAAKAEARGLQAYMLLVVQRYGYDGKLTFHVDDLRRAQQWLDSLVADAAPQQPGPERSRT